MRRIPIYAVAPFIILVSFAGCISTPNGKAIDLGRLETETGSLAQDLRDISEALGDSDSDKKISDGLALVASALDDVKAAVAAHRAGGEETAKLLAALQIAADAAARIVDDAKGDKYRTVRLVATGAKILVRRIRDSVG